MAKRPLFSKSALELTTMFEQHRENVVVLQSLLDELVEGDRKTHKALALRQQVLETLNHLKQNKSTDSLTPPTKPPKPSPISSPVQEPQAPSQMATTRYETIEKPVAVEKAGKEEMRTDYSGGANNVFSDKHTVETDSHHQEKSQPEPRVVKSTVYSGPNAKALKVVDYLSALARVTMVTVRELSSYQNVIWVSDVPKEGSHCYSRSWGRDENMPDDVWLEVRKYPEPSLPATPKQCEDWVDKALLRVADIRPVLKSEITTTETVSNSNTGELEVLIKEQKLEDHPLVQAAWNNYVEQKWLPWAAVYGKFLAVQKVFGALHGIYQEQRRLGEQFELVMCLGLLNWRQANGRVVRRHLVVAKASLEFEAGIGRFVVRAHADGDQAVVEFDMLEAESYPTNADSLVETGRMLRDNFWDRTISDSLLSAIANSLESQGRGGYKPDTEAASGVAPTEVPLVEFAPALILRKRSMKGLIQVLSDMKRQIEAGVDVPSQFSDLCEMSDANQEVCERVVSERDVVPPEQIYFPLLANDQQRQIIHKHNAQAGVLVQGPPGTGKSQTIANLICHLLATGQRVLVTSKSSRALEVLNDKIPEAIQPLCISMLGSGSDERASLEKSVNGILTKVNSRDDIGAKRMMDALERKLYDARKNKAEAENELIGLREKETFNHVVADGAYQGTAAAIAIRLRDEADMFGWLDDAVNKDDVLPLSADEITELSCLFSAIDTATEEELTQYFPDVDRDVPTIDPLRELWHKHDELSRELADGSERLASSDGMAIARANKEDIVALDETVGRMVSEVEGVRRRPMGWIPAAIKEVLQDIDTPWKELLRLTEERMKDIRPLLNGVQRLEVDVPGDADLRRLRNDAQAILEHFSSGGGLKRFGMLEHPVIKRHGELVKQARIDGRECLDSTSLNNLLHYLLVRLGLRDVWSYWEGKEQAPSTPNFTLQIAHVDELSEALSHVLSLYGLRGEVQTAVAKIVGLAPPQFAENGSLVRLSQACNDVLAQNEFRVVAEAIRKEEGKVSALAARANAHPLCRELLDAFRERNVDGYRKVVDRLRGLSRRFGGIKRKQDYLARLAVKAPRFSAKLSSRIDEEANIARLATLPKAWAWRRASTWLEHYENQDGSHIERNAKRFESDAMRAIGDLAALKAWEYCFERMQRSHQEHLETWQQAMRRLGKGTGKHAHRYRQDAQRHLNACKEAVPAWIMPLHRVFETVEAHPASFNVIIVDEASQCGYEALPLLYLAEKIIVVGDENQISPEVVGTDLTHVANLMRTHLGEFTHRDSFDIENSLFAHGRIRFGNRITLREHFRCAPEIIRFSNELCYLSDPLIPLKQCPPNRLKPLKHVHVADGYREGVGPAIVNRSEAEALVQQIIDCCGDLHYDGMSMGVIVLQGEAQAKLIEGMLLKTIGAEEMQERQILCGNPYSFQGDERDVIFLSMVSARGEGRIGALVKEKDRRRFNVAASRAKEQMWLFHSVTTNDLSKDCMRLKLLSHFLDTSVKEIAGIDIDELRREAHAAERWRETPPAPFDSWFEVDVALDIASRGYTVVPQFEFAGKRIDLVVQGGSAQLAVECDGDHWHGRDEFEADMRRQRMLERCHWVFFRVRECSYRANQEKALESLWSMLEARGIFPAEKTQPQDANDATDEGFEGEAASRESEPLKSSDAGDDSESEYFDDALDDQDEEEAGVATEGCPLSIQDALRLKPAELSHLIIEAIKSRPNHSCVRSALATLVLGNCHIRTRSGPRKLFQRKVESRVAAMIREGQLVAYKSKNERLRLGWNI